MSVVRGRPEVAFRGRQKTAFDPSATLDLIKFVLSRRYRLLRLI
jgi:hypothetical protein